MKCKRVMKKRSKAHRHLEYCCVGFSLWLVSSFCKIEDYVLRKSYYFCAHVTRFVFPPLSKETKLIVIHRINAYSSKSLNI